MIPHALIPEIALLSRNIHHCPSPNPSATTTTQGTGNNSADTRYCYRRYTPYMPYTVYTAHTYRHCTTRAIVCKWSYRAQHGNLSESLSTDSGCARLSPPTSAPIEPSRPSPAITKLSLSLRISSFPYILFIYLLSSSRRDSSIRRSLSVPSIVKPLSQTSLWRTSPATSATF